jgi:hypothetical protein
MLIIHTHGLCITPCATAPLSRGCPRYTGDEDNGSMSSWYLLTSLGLYSLKQGDVNYVLGSPLFANVTITTRCVGREGGGAGRGGTLVLSMCA